MTPAVTPTPAQSCPRGSHPGDGLIIRGSAVVDVDYHQFFLKDGEDQSATSSPLPIGGLVQAMECGLIVLAGVLGGPVQVTIEAHRFGPGPSTRFWQDVTEVCLDLPTGFLRVSSRLHGVHPELQWLTHDGPGRYHVRVHANGRNDPPEGFARTPTETYLIQAWPTDRTAPDVAREDDTGLGTWVPSPV